MTDAGAIPSSPTGVPLNVAALVPWRQLLETLAAAPASGALPCVARCPACKQATLTTYQDTILGGEWHLCSHCQLRGDSLELAAHVWSCSRADAAFRLGQLGLLEPLRATAEALAAYDAWYPQRRVQTEAFWAYARAYLPQSGAGTAAVRRHLDIHTVMNSRWEARGGRFVGAAHGEQLVEYLAPNYWLKPTRRFGRWEQQEVVLLPFHDLPGRLSAFLLALEVADGTLELVYRHAFSSIKQAVVYHDIPGVFRLEAAFTPPQAGLGDTLFVFTDPLLAAKAHLRQSNLDERLIPLVAVWPEVNPAPILRLHAPQRDIVVWGRTADADLFRLARQLNARLLCHDSKAESTDHLLRRYGSPAAWLEVLRKRAQPWRLAAYHHLQTLGLPAAETFLARLQLPRAEVREFVAAAPVDLQPRLAQINCLREHGRQIQLDGQTIVESKHGWCLAGSDEPISEVVVRVEQVCTQTGTQQVWYQGRLFFQEGEVPFTATESEIEKPLKFAARRVVEAGLGVPRYKERWQHKGLEMALAFHRPQLLTVPARYGWDQETQRFILPDFTLDARGKVAANGLPRLRSDHLPAAQLPRPIVLAPDELQRLLQSKAASVLWPALWAVLHNVLAPVYGQLQLGLVATGPGVGAAVTVAHAAGCPRITLAGTGRPSVGKLIEAEQPGSWPVAVDGVTLHGCSWVEWLQQPHNALVALDATTARVLVANGGWAALETTRVTLEREELTLVGRLVSDFLQFTAAGRLQGLWGRDPMQNLLDHLHAYVQERGLNSAPLDQFVPNLRWRRQDALAGLGELWVQFWEAGVFQQEETHPNRQKPDLRPRLELGARAVWVPRVGVNAQLHKRRLLELDVTAVTHLLQETGVWADAEARAEPCWTVRRDWWDECVQRWRTGAAPRLRLVD
jgi:hypothetical protein